MNGIIWARIMLTVLAGCGGIATLFISGVEMKNSIKDKDFYGIFLMLICIIISLSILALGIAIACGWINIIL